MGCGKNSLESSSLRGNQKNSAGCIADVVKTIARLQNNAIRHDDKCATSCFLEPMGGLTKHGRHADTRLFMLLDKLGKPFKVVFMDKECDFHFTPLFRVEDVFNNHCGTLRAVAPIQFNGNVVDLINENTDNLIPQNFELIDKYKKTESCVTVDLNDFTAIQCVADVDLNIHHH